MPTSTCSSLDIASCGVVSAVVLLCLLPPSPATLAASMKIIAAKGAISALRSRCPSAHQLQVIRLYTRITHTNGLPEQSPAVSKQRSSSLDNTGVNRGWPNQLHAIRSLQAETNSHPSALFDATDSNDQLQKAHTKPRIMLIGWLGAQKHHLDKCVVLQRTCSRHCCQNHRAVCARFLARRVATSAKLLRSKVCTAVAEHWIRDNRSAGVWHDGIIKGRAETLMQMPTSCASLQPPTAGIVLPFVGDAAAARYLDRLDQTLAVGQRMVFHIFRCCMA